MTKMMYSTTSDPSDGYSNHFSNFEPDTEEISDNRRSNKKRRIRLYEKALKI
jgi:hypothetical protein